MKRNTLAVSAALGALLAPAAQAQLSPPVLLPGDLGTAPAAEVQVNAEVFRGGDQYLLVWEDSRVQLGGTAFTGGWGTRLSDIFAMRLDANGDPVDTSPIVVSQRPFSQELPKAAWNGSEWLVVWESRRATTFWTTTGIMAARVSASGAVLDDPPIVIDDDDDVDEGFPSVASDGVGWAVFWEDYDSVQGQTARACSVDANGVVGAKKTLFNSHPTGFYMPHHIEAAFLQDRYLFVSEHVNQSGPSGILGQFLTTGLDKIGSEFQISPDGGAPWVAENGSDFYVVWTSLGTWAQTRGTPVDTSGNVAIPGGLLLEQFVQVSDRFPHVAWNGTYWVVTIERWLGSGMSTLKAFHVTLSGQLVAGPITVATQPSLGDSVVAGGAALGKGIVLWISAAIEYSDVYRATLDSTGSIGPAEPIVTGPPAQTHPDVAGDATGGYLVVFLSRSSGAHRVLGLRLDGQGVPIDTEPFEIAAGDQTLFHPRVAWNGSLWLVVWEDRVSLSSSLLTATVYGRRVQIDGTVLDATPISILPGNYPDVAALDQDFLVASSEEPTNHVRPIRSMRVSGATGATLGTVQTVGTSYARFPSVEKLGDRWLVTWQRNATHDSPISDIRGAFVAATGVPQPAFVVENTAGNTHDPAIAVLGDVATVFYDDGDDLRARRIDASGTLLGSDAGFVVCTAPNDQNAPSAASDGTDIFAAWVDYRVHPPLEAGLGDVFSTTVDAAGNVADLTGVAVADDPFSPEGGVAVAGDAGVTVVVHADFRTEAPFGTYRIALRTRDQGGLGTNYCIASPNSTGSGAVISAIGSASVSTNDLRFEAAPCPPGEFGVFFYGPDQTQVPLANGFRCVAAGATGLFRLPVAQANAAGLLAAAYDLTQPPSAAGQIVSGSTWNFQAWYRDPGAGGGNANLSDAVEIVFTP